MVQLHDPRYGSFLHCRRTLNERAIQNKEISDEAIRSARKESRLAGEDLESPEAKEREKALRHRALEIEKLKKRVERRPEKTSLKAN